MEKSNDSDTSNSWIFVDENADSTNEAIRKYYINCMQETVQELSESDLNKAKNEPDSESDGISVISEGEDGINDTLKAIEEDNIVEPRNVEQNFELQSVLRNSNCQETNTGINNWLIAIGILLLSILITFVFNDVPITEENLNAEPSSNELFKNQDFYASHEIFDSEQHQTISEENIATNADLRNKFKHTFENKIVNDPNIEHKYRLKHKKSLKSDNEQVETKDHPKVEHFLINEEIYSNEIKKEKDGDLSMEKIQKILKRKGKEGSISDKEIQLEIREQYLKRKETFLLNKEYKLLQKEIELEQLMKGTIDGSEIKTFDLKHGKELKNKSKKEIKHKDGIFKKKKKEKYDKKASTGSRKNNKHSSKADAKQGNPENVHKIIHGDWYNELHNNREILRKLSNNCHKARWYFQWMKGRGNLRQNNEYAKKKS